MFDLAEEIKSSRKAMRKVLYKDYDIVLDCYGEKTLGFIGIRDGEISFIADLYGGCDFTPPHPREYLAELFREALRACCNTEFLRKEISREGCAVHFGAICVEVQPNGNLINFIHNVDDYLQ